MLGSILLVLVLIWLAVIRWKGRKLRMVAKQLRSDLSSLPLIGNAHHFIGDGERRMTVIRTVGQQAIKYEGWSSVTLGPSFYGLVASAEDAEHVLKVHLEKDDILKLTRVVIGNGLIFAPVSIWRPRRKVMAPTFSQHNLKQFVDIFSRQSTIMAERLDQMAGGGAFSVWNYATSYTMDSVCQTTLGVDMGIQKNADHMFLKSFQLFADLTAKRIFCPWLHDDVHFKYLGMTMYTQIMKTATYLKGFVDDIIAKKRVEIKENNENEALNQNNTKTEDGKSKFKPILELLIEASGGDKGYTNNELQEETQVLLLAGTDTSAVGVGFTMVMLALYPDIQEKIYKEIQEVFGVNSDKPAQFDDLSKMTYLEACVKESLRLYPPVPITARKILKDDVTPSGIKLTSGMGVVISMFSIHRNPKYWGADAEQYRPERFFDSPPTHPAAYMPFSAGPRNCLGYKYAMMSMMTAIFTVLRRYRILPPDDIDFTSNKNLRVRFDIMMKHVDNFEVKLERRK